MCEAIFDDGALGASRLTLAELKHCLAHAVVVRIDPRYRFPYQSSSRNTEGDAPIIRSEILRRYDSVLSDPEEREWWLVNNTMTHFDEDCPGAFARRADLAMISWKDEGFGVEERVEALTMIAKEVQRIGFELFKAGEELKLDFEGVVEDEAGEGELVIEPCLVRLGGGREEVVVVGKVVGECMVALWIALEWGNGALRSDWRPLSFKGRMAQIATIFANLE